MSAQLDRTVVCWVIGLAFLVGCGMEVAGESESERAVEGALGTNLDTASPESVDMSHNPWACKREKDCGDGLACVNGACQACIKHSDCQSDVCDLGAATSKGPGACIKQEDVVYVAERAHGCAFGDGSWLYPVCQIRDAIPLMTGNKSVMRVYAGQYKPFKAYDRSLHLIGPENGGAIVGNKYSEVGARIFAANVILDGVSFGRGVRAGVVCEHSNLKVLRGRISGDLHGIWSDDCDLEVDQVRARGKITGLTLKASRSYRITNNDITAKEGPAVVFRGKPANPAYSLFAFNTVIGAGSHWPGGIDCGAHWRTLKDSIVVGNHPAAHGAQTIGACIHERVVVGCEDNRHDAGLIDIDPDLAPSGRLLDTWVNRAYVIDKGDLWVSSLYRDFAGTGRPFGLSNDIGAHEFTPWKHLDGEAEPEAQPLPQVHPHVYPYLNLDPDLDLAPDLDSQTQTQPEPEPDLLPLPPSMLLPEPEPESAS